MNNTKKFFKYNNTRRGEWSYVIGIRGFAKLETIYTIKNPPIATKFIYIPPKYEGPFGLWDITEKK